VLGLLCQRLPGGATAQAEGLEKLKKENYSKPEILNLTARQAQAHALVSIAESLEKLVGATSDQSDSAYLNVVTHVGG
jgi:hypothetical protein